MVLQGIRSCYLLLYHHPFLPKETTTIDLSLTINYVQSDDKEEGDIPTTTTPVSKTYEVGDEIALGDEHF